ncbi:MAG: HEAT repeat domain-containing protein [Candidatus Cloacimonetes bacterium]|nr:HEAT repeat domain-containing protein [Candidatus Cloacimonadota bacterium]
MLSVKNLLVILVILGQLTLLAAGVMKDHEYTLIDSLLVRADLETNSLNFVKDWSLSTEFKIKQIIDVINTPLEFPRFVDDLNSLIESRDLISLTNFLVPKIFEYDDYSLPIQKTVEETDEFFQQYFTQKVRQPKDLFSYGEMLFARTENYRKRAFAALTEKDMGVLTWLSYTMWSDSGDKERYQKLKPEVYRDEYEDLEMKDLKEILDKIDWGHLFTAVRVFNQGVLTLKENLHKIDFTNKSPLTRDTAWGRFIIGTKGDDVYREPFVFMIESAGNDIYYSDLYTDFKQPYYLVIDMAGDDIWRNDTPGSMNRVLGGIGWMMDLEGNDRYYGDDLAFSAFLGYQYHYDGGGDDIYRLGRYSLSAATFGLSININEEGNDIYYTTGYSHGFGGTLGTGLLIDHSGNDLYYAGGKYLHAPLRPDDYRSMAQGFGFGVRPDWGGGIGILYDESGNDSYEGAVYAQGVGYWYALGILLDSGGNDTFNAVQYAQGSGIHLAGGFLYNAEGDDTYYSRFGPGQGAGHDYAVGFFIDRAGDDHYSIDGGNGLGLTNSVGIFLDVEGNDRYERNRLTNYGYANEARDSGGIGIFMDLDGDDIYPDDTWGNNDFWIRGVYGIGIDTEQLKEEEEVVKIKIDDESLVEIDTLTTVSEIFEIASEWEVGSSIERVRRARIRILDFEEEAAEYILTEKLNTKSGLEYRAILDFAQKSELMQEYLAKGLAAEDTLTVKNTISLIGELKLAEYLPKLEKFIQEKKYLPALIGALGEFSDDTVLAMIIPFIESKSEHLRFITARSLKKIDTPLSRSYLNLMANDRSFLVRTTVKLALTRE